MPDRKEERNDDRDQNKNNSDFVRERILNQAESRRRMIRRVAALIGSAIVFGVIACLTFVFLRPRLEPYFVKEEPETQIHIPRDDETESASEEESTDVPETTEAETEPISTEDIQDVIESAVDSHNWSAADYSSLYSGLDAVADEVGKAVVTVTITTQETDWFDNTIETEGSISGIIWNITDSDIYILTDYQQVSGDRSVEITFCNGSKARAEVRATDSRTGIAVLSVELSAVEESTREAIGMVTLGNSLHISKGQPVILVGSPGDYVGSVIYGMISYIRTSVQQEDMSVRMMYMDVLEGTNSNGYVIDMEGQLIGVITKNSVGSSMTAIGISDLKMIIEKLSNGQSFAYLGVVGQEVTEEISQKNRVPRGIYISDVTVDSPAYSGGLQSGDVITYIDGEEIYTVKAIQTILENKSRGDILTIQVQRPGRDSYVEMNFNIILGSR